ncbi:MAG TPA: 30S ribosomal protein S4 [Candidatus Norongarragalinales archaeon]|nr:30S ribosomal protein S4 [Candidatus Norongarragalinales archaeon]
MGDPVRKSKKYERPKKLWDKKRIEEEGALKTEFGLKNSRELWIMQTILRRIRREARRLLSGKGANAEIRSTQLLARSKKFFVQKEDLTLDDLLSLSVKDVLQRRLQSIVVKKRLAKTMHQARQFITHGHVSINGMHVSSPSYLVSFAEEANVNWSGKPLGSFEKMDEKPAVVITEKTEPVAASG